MDGLVSPDEGAFAAVLLAVDDVIPPVGVLVLPLRAKPAHRVLMRVMVFPGVACVLPVYVCQYERACDAYVSSSIFFRSRLLRRGKELSLTTNDREDSQLFYISSFRKIIAMFSERIEGRLVNVAYKLRGRDTQREGFAHKRTDLVPSLAPGLGYALAYWGPSGVEMGNPP